MAHKQFSLVFLSLVLLHLLLLDSTNLWLIGISKNLIITSLLVFWVAQTKLKTTLHRWVLAALIFCFFGDLLLQFAQQGQLFFILGLASFLVAHLFYALAFVSEPEYTLKPNLSFWLKSIVPMLLGVCMVWVLWPHLGTLKIPVMLYAFFIAGMAALAINRPKKIKQSFVMVASGAFLFIFSDAVLAYNKFVTPIPLAAYIIMATYAAANYYIVLGLYCKAIQTKL